MMASWNEYKMTIREKIHVRHAKLGEPLSIDVGGGEIIIMHLKKPGLELLINLPASCGLDAIFEALGNRRFHVPPQGRAIKVTMPGVRFNHDNLSDKHNFDSWETEPASSESPISYSCSSPQTRPA